MKEIPIILKFCGQHKHSRDIKKELRKKMYHGVQGKFNGYCEAKVKPAGFKIWINSRQTDREMVDSFFHEMTHLLLKIRFTRKRININKWHNENLANWMGYIAKMLFADRLPYNFRRMK